jgi:hypothetical protein
MHKFLVLLVLGRVVPKLLAETRDGLAVVAAAYGQA